MSMTDQLSDQAKPGQSGFSLIEMLAALMIIGIIASTLLVIRNNSIHEARVAQNTRQAWLLAQRKYTALKHKTPTTLESRSGSFPEHQGYRWETRVQRKKISLGSPSSLLQNTSQNGQSRRLYRIQLIVTYPGYEPGNRKQIQLQLIRFSAGEHNQDLDRNRNQEDERIDDNL